MEIIAMLQSKMKLIDERIIQKYVDELRNKEHRIDFTKDGWVEVISSIETEFRRKIEPELIYIRQMVTEALVKIEYKDRQVIASLLEQTHRLKDYFTLDSSMA
jgi:hypothetical protein